MLHWYGRAQPRYQIPPPSNLTEQSAVQIENNNHTAPISEITGTTEGEGLLVGVLFLRSLHSRPAPLPQI
jgi:hypothetical protein